MIRLLRVSFINLFLTLNLLESEKKKDTPKELFETGKSIYFLPGIVLSVGWTILNFLKIIAYVGQLKNEYPTCSMSNPNRIAILIPTVIAVAISKRPLETFSYGFFFKIIPVK